MIPISHGNLRDCLIACLIAAGVWGLIRLFPGGMIEITHAELKLPPTCLKTDKRKMHSLPLSIPALSARISSPSQIHFSPTVRSAFVQAPGHGIVTIVSVNSRTQR
jgi:hypothetical protein